MADLMSPVAHIAPHVAHVKPIIHAVAATKGFSMLTLLISNVSSAALAGGLSWYIRGRGMTGVGIDIQNMKNEIEKLKNVSAPAA